MNECVETGGVAQFSFSLHVTSSPTQREGAHQSLTRLLAIVASFEWDFTTSFIESRLM